ncbi:hypothetical protein PWT90_07717 [Aphanocladium album]|nr:hypothetical protein PWT90_07717 [Aphanocladium album]
MTVFNRREIRLIYSHTNREFFPCPTALRHEMMEITRLRVACHSSKLSVRTLLRRASRAASGIHSFAPENWRESYDTNDSRFDHLGHIYKTSILLYALLSLPPRLAACFDLEPEKSSVARTLARRQRIVDKARELYRNQLFRLFTAAWTSIPKLTLAWPTAVLGVAVASNEEQRRQYAAWLEELKWSGEVDGAVGMAPLLEQFWYSGKTEWDDCCQSGAAASSPHMQPWPEAPASQQHQRHPTTVHTSRHSFIATNGTSCARPHLDRLIHSPTDTAPTPPPAMKPVVSAGHAWSWYVPKLPCEAAPVIAREATPSAGRIANSSYPRSTVVSVFAIIILSVLAIVYRTGHEEFVGGNDDPEPEEGVAMSGTIFTAVFVYLSEVMRLLNTRSLELEFFAGGDIPSYAILSHTWEAGEVTFHELLSKSYDVSSQGWIKIQRSAQLAAAQELQYIWIDTCCIDKSSSAELSEAINSMFQWYEQAAICYVYLCDVAAGLGRGDFTSSSGQGTSRWFSRGWTLQELIAPRQVEFYNRDWQSMGRRDSLGSSIHEITRVPHNLLYFAPTSSEPTVSHALALRSVAEKMSWAARRVTTREEDTAYSLLGLFDINMPLLYGEGRAKAFRRLQEEIIRSTDDESIFVWRLDAEPLFDGNPFCGLLADGPERFGLFTDLIPRRSRYLSTKSKRSTSIVSKLGVQIDLPLTPFPCDESGTIFLALLACDMRREATEATFSPAILLQRTAHEDETKFVRVRADLVPLCMMNRVVAPHKLTSLITELQKRQMPRDGVHSEEYYVGNIIFKTIKPMSIFVPNTVMPSLMPNGILLFPELQAEGGGGSSSSSPVKIASRSPTWQIFSDNIDCYEVNFRVNPVLEAGRRLTEPVICGALELVLENQSPLSSLGMLGPKTMNVCLVAGLEPLPANPFGTPGLYAVPWYAFEETDKVEAGDLDRVKDKSTRLTELMKPFGVKAEFGYIVRYSWLFYHLQLMRC